MLKAADFFAMDMGPNASSTHCSLSLVPCHGQGGPRPTDRCAAFVAAATDYRCHGALDAAIAMFEQALLWSRAVIGVDMTVDMLCELSETHALQDEHLNRLGRPSNPMARDKARDHAFEAVHLAARTTDPRWEATVLLRVSDLLDRLGDHEDATELQVRALRHGADIDPPFDLVGCSADTLHH